MYLMGLEIVDGKNAAKKAEYSEPTRALMSFREGLLKSTALESGDTARRARCSLRCCQIDTLASFREARN
jgi:hypothetical protein